MSDKEKKEKKKGESEDNCKNNDSESDKDLAKYSELDDSAKKLLVYTKAVTDKARQGVSPKSYSNETSDPEEANKKYVHRLLGFIPAQSQAGSGEEEEDISQGSRESENKGSDEAGKDGSDIKDDFKENRGQRIKDGSYVAAGKGKSDKNEKYELHDNSSKQDNRMHIKDEERPGKEDAFDKSSKPASGNDRQFPGEISRNTSNAENQQKAQHGARNFIEEETGKDGHSSKEQKSKEDGGIASNENSKEEGLVSDDKEMTPKQPKSGDKTRLGGGNTPNGKLAGEVEKYTLESDLLTEEDIQPCDSSESECGKKQNDLTGSSSNK